MTRFVNPVPQFFDDAGNVLASGKLFFYETGTTTLKNTYSDSDLTTPNTNPVILDGEGRVATGDGEIFLSGDYNVHLLDSNDVQIWERDPVSNQQQLLNMWVSGTDYRENQIVVGSDGFFYLSLINNNQGNDPTVDDGTNWTRVQFLQDWAKGKTFNNGEWVVGSDNHLYIALSSNINNDPTDQVNNHAIWADFNGGPIVKPVNQSPTDGQTNVSNPPLLAADDFEIRNSNETQTMSRWQASLNSDFSTIEYDSTWVLDDSQHQVSNALLDSTLYYFRVQYASTNVRASEYSEPTEFTTGNSTPVGLVYIKTLTYAGTGANNRQINTGVDTSSDETLIWIKSHSASDHEITTSASPFNLGLYVSSNDDSAASSSSNKVLSTNSIGIELGNDSGVNANGLIYSLMQFRKKTNLCDFVTYTGDGAPVGQFPHDMSVAPAFMLIKRTDVAGDWFVYHKDLGNNQKCLLNTDDLVSAATEFASLTPNAADFFVSGDLNIAAANYIAVLFADNPADGIEVGSYTKTSNLGNKLIATNLTTPQFAIVKNYDNTALNLNNWAIIDRNMSVDDSILQPNVTDAKTQIDGPTGSNYAFNASDITLNVEGFGGTGNGDERVYGGSTTANYIYIAFSSEVL
jgi:hypothetical protein